MGRGHRGAWNPLRQHIDAGAVKAGRDWLLSIKFVDKPIRLMIPVHALFPHNITSVLVASDGPHPILHFLHTGLL